MEAVGGADRTPIERLVRRVRLEWRRRRRRRERSCVRCGALADGVCPACRGRICADCAVVSIETGAPVALCLSCSGVAAPASGLIRRRSSPWLLFRRGAALIVLVVVVAAGLALEREGWPGAWRVLLAVLHPALLLGLVPLAVVLGGLMTLARRALFGSS